MPKWPSRPIPNGTPEICLSFPSPELRGRKILDPSWLVVWIVPEYVVASYGNTMLFSKSNHGISSRIVLSTRRWLIRVPLHFIFKADGEARCFLLKCEVCAS